MKNEGNTSDKIIQLLKNSKHPYLSGQTLSKSLGVSRTAIWKHIK
ncbi:MAG: HTH domain-containing protein, partial [Deltaproteobacteria bacterium]|nr:HTH domain-containing protein [Deltaproteobacteria bacterium]